MDFTVIEDIEKSDCVGNSGGIVPSGDHGKKLITETLFVRHCIALLRKRNEQPLHESREGGGFTGCCCGDILINAASSELVEFISIDEVADGMYRLSSPVLTHGPSQQNVKYVLQSTAVES
jgi:hypothetical protein